MAEGFARARWGDRMNVCSAGIEAHGLNPDAVRVMAERDVDISGQTSDTVDAFPDVRFDLVVTVCAHADAHCPTFPGGAARVVHVGFDDPPKLAAGIADPEAALGPYRRVRDEIRDFIERLPELLSADRA